MLGTQDSHLPLPLAQARLVDESSYIPPPPSYRASVHDQPSLDLPQRIEQKLAQYNASENICKRWLFEIASVATSAICMGAIIGLLHYLDNQSLSKWPLGLTIITILSKIASAALILPISEAIGQLKWTWFHGKKSRDAFDFEIFDKASRGAWGSVMLLCRTKGRSLAALGALLTVLLLAIDSFFQQVTDMPERWKLQGASSIPRSIQYTPSVVLAYDNTWDDTPITQMNQDLKRALDPFFYDQNGTRPLATENGTQATIPLLCPTSKCEWPDYQSLGICSACEDVSYLLDYSCIRMKMDWIRNSTGPGTEDTYPTGIACGYFLNATSESPVLMSGYRVENFTNSSYGETLLMRTLPLVTNPTREALYGGSINFKHINYPLMDALIVSAADGTADSVYRKARPVAHECMLSWCVKTFRSSYAWGGYEEEVVETFMNTTQAQYPWSTERLSVDSTLIGFDNDITIVPPNIEHNIAGFGVSNDTFVNTVIVLDEVFPSLITVSNPLAERYVKIRTSFTDQVMFREVRFNPWLAPNNVTNHMERIAEAMTNTVRSDPNSHELIIGTAFSRETYVMVHWAWLTFPITMLLFSIVFLGATMVKTSQQKYSDIGTYKSSAIPTLMYGLPREIQRDFTTSAVSSRAFSRRSKKVRIRLNPKQGWRVSGQMYLQPTVPSSNT
ncbi:hypothetical protein P3342_000109 [Pyrenophora teres f. teres]|uniref:DUF3176 domain containing protein n=1 Tax=Pyrenophora teres f. teres TaxID=97479 RepID=A0A6S6V7R4_9PLEO|nr:hypothetical protein PTNB85_04700 [Pyrenophora teres f. teres]KAE8840213.1 hypothetical protein HRS9122_06818 [Pyrenophora teres f. teres]KAE8862191.1 hypothetical protein PTNB29_04753 [Pyrenophora teres f. teres]KAE8869566.1 hypothetical protein PTNB73_04619 [Pyrenophora teres f. teres]KAK1917396.1 hypothetical protein P3342_000109 [Pyrenophora teres f. teres]